MKKRYSVSIVIICFVFAVFSIIFMLPLLWTLFSSFKPESSIMGDPGRFFPTTYTLVHYNTLLTQIPFFRIFMTVDMGMPVSMEILTQPWPET